MSPVLVNANEVERLNISVKQNSIDPGITTLVINACEARPVVDMVEAANDRDVKNVYKIAVTDHSW